MDRMFLIRSLEEIKAIIVDLRQEASLDLELDINEYLRISYVNIVEAIENIHKAYHVMDNNSN